MTTAYKSLCIIDFCVPIKKCFKNVQANHSNDVFQACNYAFGDVDVELTKYLKKIHFFKKIVID